MKECDIQSVQVQFSDMFCILKLLYFTLKLEILQEKL